MKPIRKTLRYVLYALAGAILLVVAAMLAVVTLFDPNEFKPEIERAMKEQKQRSLRLEGPIKLAFFPSLGLSVGKATLSERASDKVFASIDSAHVSVAVLPLLRGAVVVDEVRLAGLSANIVRFKGGRTNIDSLLKAGGAKPETAGPDAAEPKTPPVPAGKTAARAPVRERLQFDITGVRIERSSVTYRDEVTAQELAVTGLELRTGRIASEAPGTLQLAAALKGRNPALDLKLQVAAGYRINFDRLALGFKDIDVRLAGDVPGVTGLALTVKGSLDADPEHGRFGAHGLTADARGTLGKDAFEAKLRVPKLTLQAEQAGGDAVNADFTLKGGERAVVANLKLSGIHGSAKEISVSDIELQLDARAADASLKGTLKAAFAANPAGQVYEISKLNANLVATSPSLPQKTLMLPLTGSLRADLGREELAAQLGARLDDGRLQAKFGLTRFAAPQLSFDIDLDRLDLDRYLPGPAKPAADGAAKPAPNPAAEADLPVDLAPLKGLQASGRIAVGALTVKRVKVANLRAQLRLADGRLRLEPQTASVYGGSLSGSIALDAEGNRIAIKQNLSDVQVGPLVMDLVGRDALEGRGKVAVDLAGAGASVNAIKRSLAGSVRFALHDGAVKGVNLAESLRRARAALGSKSAQQQEADSSQKTPFSELAASLTVRDGVAHNDDLAIRSPVFRIGGAGDIDLGASKLDYTAKATVGVPAKGPADAELAPFSGLTVPVRISGPFDAVKIDIDYGAVIGGAVKAKAKEAVQEKARDKLRNLLRR